MNNRTAAILIGIIFIVVGILGFIPNPLIGVSEGVLFHADTVHSMVHIISGALFLIVAFAAPLRVPIVLKVFGVVYFLLGVLGLLTIGSEGLTHLLGFLCVNGPDNYLHIGLGIVIFIAGTLKGPNVHVARNA